MILELSHTKLDIFKLSREFTLLCYQETKTFPADEHYAIVQQIRRAALSVHLSLLKVHPGDQKQKGKDIMKLPEDH